MNSNIPPGITRWKPSVTLLPDQWTTQNPPGVARGKVWQPKSAPPPPNTFPQTKIDDLSEEHLEDVVAGGYPLDLSTLRPVSSSRQTESPLDLSLKTRKRCADSTLQCQQYGQIGKKMCLPSQERIHTHGRSHDQHSHVQHGIAERPVMHGQQYISNVERMHQNSVHASSKREFQHSRQNATHIDTSLLKQDYVSKQHVQNVQTSQNSGKGYISNHSEMRQRYQNQTLSRQFPSSGIQPFTSEIPKVSQHSYSTQQRIGHQQTHDVAKYQNYANNFTREREHMYREHSQYYSQMSDVMSNIQSVSSSSKAAEAAHYHIMSQVQQTVQTTASMVPCKYSGTRSAHDSYEYLRHSPAATATHSRTGPCVSSRSQSIHQSRPSVLSGGLQFKQPQECCSPDSTNAMASPAEYPVSFSRTQIAHNPSIANDFHLRKHFEAKGGCVSSTSYTPSSSPRCGNIINSQNIISNMKPPSSRTLSKSPGSVVTELLKAENTHQSRSIIMGTSGTVKKEVPQESVIRHSRPRLWNPDQLKQNMYKHEKDTTVPVKQECLNLSHTDTKTSETVPKSEFASPLEISIPHSKATDSKTEHKPKPFSKKHIIMNAFRNDESMKHILEEQKKPIPVQPTDTIKSTSTVVRSHENAVFLSPESPKMPTLSPQQKLPGPKVSPLMREPPTLDIAASQGNRRKQHKVSPNRNIQLKHPFNGTTKLSSDQHDYSIQPQSNFPQRPKLSYKKIPIANVAPMVHGKCQNEEKTPEVEKETTNNDLKQLMSAPAPQAIHAYRVNSSVTNHQGLTACGGTECVDIAKQKNVDLDKTNIFIKKKMPKVTKTKLMQGKQTNECKDGLHCSPLIPQGHFTKVTVHDATMKTPMDNVNEKPVSKNPDKKTDVKQSKRKPRFISNTKRKADEIRRRVRERNTKGCIAGRIRNRYRLRLSKPPKGFIDFQPEVLASRTRRKSAGKRGYHRNAAYEKELWREENRKAFRHRQRVRRYTKRLSLKPKAIVEKNISIPNFSTETQVVDQVENAVQDTSLQNVDADNSGTWEIRNTSTTLRNGKSKSVSMKILFKPQEQRRFRRRMRKRGKVRYGLRKAVSAPSKFISHYREQVNNDVNNHSHLSGVDPYPADFSHYDFDQNDSIGNHISTQYIPLLPEVKKLSVCKDTGETILHRAARMGHEDAALSYLQTGAADVNVVDNAGYTPLHESCVSGNMVIARMLLSYGAMVNCASQDGIRPIHDAVDNDFVPLVRLLLSYGADPTISTYGGKTPLRIAHSQKMRSLIQGYLGDINGFEDNEQSVWEFSGYHKSDVSEENDVFEDVPSDPEIEDEIFEESSSPLVHEYTINHSATSEKSSCVVLKDLTEFLHIKTGDLLKDKAIKSVIIEESKEAIKESIDCSCYHERLHNVFESSCRLLPVNQLHLVFSKFDKKKIHDKGKKSVENENILDERKKISEKEKKRAEMLYEYENDHDLIHKSKSPKHKPSRSHLDLQ